MKVSIIAILLLTFFSNDIYLNNFNEVINFEGRTQFELINNSENDLLIKRIELLSDEEDFVDISNVLAPFYKSVIVDDDTLRSKTSIKYNLNFEQILDEWYNSLGMEYDDEILKGNFYLKFYYFYYNPDSTTTSSFYKSEPFKFRRK